MKKRIIIIVLSILAVVLMAVAVFWTHITEYFDQLYGTIDKPVIYMYPEEESEIAVLLGYPERLTVSYPKYSEGWDVIASPDGSIVDKSTGRELYALYYEANNEMQFDVCSDGFVIEGTEDALVPFFEEKLALLGLNYKESEEFIIYWTPILMEYDYVYIRFASEDEINDAMPLSITPAPDTTIRVLMTYKGLDKPLDVEEQIIEPVQRNGYVVVEWGGTEIVD